MTKKMRFSMIMAITALLCIIAAVFVSPEQVQAAAKTKISKCSITVKDATYTGGKVTPKVTVKYKKKALKEGKDYKLTFKNNTELGKGTCTIQGIGKYKGKVTKKFNIKLDTVKEIELLVLPEGEGSDAYQYKEVFPSTVVGATGYIFYHCETEDGVYMEFERKSASSIAAQFDFVNGSFIKVQAFCLKDGKCYYSDMSKAFELDYEPIRNSVLEYTVTNSTLKAPSKIELVFEEIEDTYGYTREAEFYLKLTNEPETECEDWYVEFYGENDVPVYMGFFSKVDIANGDCYLELYDSINTVVRKGESIKKILIIPIDVGPDGRLNSYSPTNLNNSDDKYAEGRLFEYEISEKYVDAGQVELSIVNDRGWEEIKLPNSFNDYLWLELYANDVFDVSEGMHSLVPYFDKEFNRYIGSFFVYDEEFFENQDNATITMLGGTKVEFEGANKVTICADYYTARFK